MRVNIVNIIFKAVVAGMGIAVIVLSALGELDTSSGFSMLGLGLACAGIYLLSKKD
ncbi:MAG: hypothetical protein IKV96_01370 [Firmicutes bacterium]|nr:hypothetical protein [Bacillota bacterium]